MSATATLREQIARLGASLFERGLSPGSSGNLSARVDDGILVTPTNACLGRLDPARISHVGWDGTRRSGDQPSKEAFLHLAMYQERPTAGGVVHLHSTHAVAVSCLDGLDPVDALPPITAYYVMRVGRLRLLPYFPPGDRALAQAVRAHAAAHHALLLANHGPVLAGATLEAAAYAVEELEETARLYLLLHGRPTRYLTTAQVEALRAQHPSG